ncbi:MAG: ATP-binding protein, partial [Cyanobacteria bacterium P01_H01_bin.130]
TSVAIACIQGRHSQNCAALVCAQLSDQRPWPSTDLELLRGIGDQVATALDQAALYSQAQTAAHQAEERAQELACALKNLKATQTHLIQAEKMSGLGQMVAGIAHEVNNPVAFIHGNITYANQYLQDLLKIVDAYGVDYPQPPPAVQAVQQELDVDVEFLRQDFEKLLKSMQIGADRIRQIVLSLKNFARFDRAGMKPMDLHEGIEDSLMILQHRLKATAKTPAVKVERHYANVPTVVCHGGQLNQVFMNILTNAIDSLEEKFSRSPTAAAPDDAETAANAEAGILTITTQVFETGDAVPDLAPEARRLDGPSIRVCIQDNGEGIPAAMQEQLFDPFFTTKPVGQGTGLGLAIAYQIVVEHHQGKIWCDSQEGQGSTFFVEIPL